MLKKDNKYKNFDDYPKQTELWEWDKWLAMNTKQVMFAENDDNCYFVLEQYTTKVPPCVQCRVAWSLSPYAKTANVKCYGGGEYMHLNFNIMRDQNFKPSTKFNLLASCMTLRNYLRGHKKIINPPFLHPLLVFNSPFRLYLAYRLAPSLSLAPPSKAVHVARSQSSASDAV